MYIAIITSPVGNMGFTASTKALLNKQIATNFVARRLYDLPTEWDADTVLASTEAGLWTAAVQQYFVASATEQIHYATA